MAEDLDPYLRAWSRLGASELSPYVAGQVGQAVLIRLAGAAHPHLDQHVAAVKEAIAHELGRRRKDPAQSLAFLVKYATGFVDAAAGNGWRPSPVGDLIDWESMRLAAVCMLMNELTMSAADSEGSRAD
jgi:hypothetical protein